MALSASDRDPSADPGVDFYRFANGGWLDANPIPKGYGSWGAFEEVGKRNELALRCCGQARQPRGPGLPAAACSPGHPLY